MENEILYKVETRPTQVARRPKKAKDGSLVVWLTRKHYAVFMYVAQRVLAKPSFTPSYQEIADFCGYKNRDSAYKAVRIIAENGLLSTDLRQARSIKVTEAGETAYRAWLAAEEKRREYWRSKKQ